MRLFTVVSVLALTFSLAHAQQYGWIRVAQLGNQFTNLNAVEFVDSLYGWTAQGGSAIYRTSDGGNNWVAYSGSPMGVNSISMVDTLNGWCVGAQGSTGKIIRTTDGGITWVEQQIVNNRSYNGTAAQTKLRNVTSGSTRNFSPDTGKVAKTTNGGTNWIERTISDSINQLRKVQFIDSLHGWVTVFGPGGVLRTTDGGQSWVPASTAPLFNAISFMDTLNGWGIGTSTVFRTTNAGFSWAPLSNVEDPIWGPIISSALSFVDSLNGWAFGTMFYQGDLTAVIFRTTDGGLSWAREFVGGGSRHIYSGKLLDRCHGWAVGDFGSVFAYRIITGVPEHLDRVPKSFSLHQNYPNPFNPTTSIEYEVLRRSHMTITVYDVNGKEVAKVVDAEHEAGAYRLSFDARNLSSGVYYYTMKTPSYTVTKQMALIK